jgi:hypothetical protein
MHLAYWKFVFHKPIKVCFMKKIFLAAIALIGTYGISAANVMTVHNLTGCSYTLSTNVGTTLLTVGPGTTTFTSPGGSSYFATKIIYNYGSSPSISIGVGIPPGFPPYSNSSSYPYTPPCLTTSYYTASWAQASSTADATLVIF